MSEIYKKARAVNDRPYCLKHPQTPVIPAWAIHESPAAHKRPLFP